MASQSAPSSSSGSSTWRRLLESGVFNASYPHRISACFQFLDADNLGYFTLRDLTERGKFVFTSLSIPPSHDTSFAVMDIFRTFDRSGTGRVHAEEFVVGIAQHVLRLSADAKLMDDIAAELMQHLSPQGITSSIVSALDDPAPKLLSRCPLFCANMLALKYRVSANLQSAYPRGVSREKLAWLLSESMDEAIAEAQAHFHLPAARLADLLADDFSYAAPHGAPPASEQHLKAVAAAAKRLGPHTVVWAPEGKAAATPSTRRSIYLSGSGAASRPEEDDGSDDEASDRAGGGGAMAAQRRGTLPGMRRGSVDTLVGYLAELGLPDGPGSEEAFESLDHDQVFLLQTAYRSLDSFFALMAQPEAPQRSLRAEGLRLLMCDGDAEGGGAEETEAGAGLGAGAYSDRARTPSLADSVLPPLTAKRAGDAPSLPPGSSGASVEGELALALALSTDRLRRAEMRIEVLQMVQSHVLGGVEPLPAPPAPSAADEPGETASTPAAALPAAARSAPSTQPVEHARAPSLLRVFAGEGSDGRQPSSSSAAKTSTPALTSTDATTTASAASAAQDSKTASSSASSSDSLFSTMPRPALPSFADILAELGHVKALVAQRGADSSALGVLLKAPSAILPVDGPRAVGPTLVELDGLSARLRDTLQRVRLDEEAHTQLREAERRHAEKDAELRQLEEHIKPERARSFETSVELQMCKEDLKRLQIENLNAQHIYKKLAAVQNDNKDLANQLAEARRKVDNLQEALLAGDPTHTHLEETARLKAQIADLQQKEDRMQKENNRLENAFSSSNLRMRETLHKNQAQQKLLHATQDELEESRAYAAKLTGEITTLKGQLQGMAELERRVRLLDKTLEARGKELESTREEAKTIARLKQELGGCFERIVDLEDKLNAASITADLADSHVKTLEEEKSLLRAAQRENLDLRTDKVTLEQKLKDLQRLEESFHQCHAENSELRVKVDRLPALVGMVAKLKASSRASVYALREQDREVEQFRRKETALTMDIQALRAALDQRRDVEAKLREREEEVETKYIPLAAEAARLREELARCKDDLSKSSTRWRKLRGVVTTHESVLSDDASHNNPSLAKLAKALRKSLGEDHDRHGGGGSSSKKVEKD